MRAHTTTTTTKARVGARRRTKRTILPGGILALSLAAVLLGATASSASAEATLIGPNPFDFGDRQVGTASPAKEFYLSVYNASFSPRIRVSDDYAQTNDCPPTLTDPPSNDGITADCIIAVIFTPRGTGPKQGTLSVGRIWNGTVVLTGAGVTTPTPPALPLTLDGSASEVLLRGKRLKFSATTNNASTLVATGGRIRKTTTQLAADKGTTIKTKVKHLKRLARKPGLPRVKIKLAATDEFGQTATDELEAVLCTNPEHFEFGKRDKQPCRPPR